MPTPTLSRLTYKQKKEMNEWKNGTKQMQLNCGELNWTQAKI